MKTSSKNPILGLIWQSTVLGAIGIVATQISKDEWQAYMGVVKNRWAEEYAAERLIDHGARLTARQARIFFPRLDSGKYRQ